MQRVVVVGGPGSGKTTLAQRVASAIDCEHIELDALWWAPNWSAVGSEELRLRVATRVADANRWVIDGNYLNELEATVSSMADTIVWLDLPRHVGFRRAVFRAARRIVTRELLWQTNRQGLRDLSPGSLKGLWRRWPEYPAEIAVWIRSLNGPDVVQLHSRRGAERWLSSLSRPTR